MIFIVDTTKPVAKNLTLYILMMMMMTTKTTNDDEDDDDEAKKWVLSCCNLPLKTVFIPLVGSRNLNQVD